MKLTGNYSFIVFDNRQKMLFDIDLIRDALNLRSTNTLRTCNLSELRFVAMIRQWHWQLPWVHWGMTRDRWITTVLSCFCRSLNALIIAFVWRCVKTNAEMKHLYGNYVFDRSAGGNLSLQINSFAAAVQFSCVFFHSEYYWLCTRWSIFTIDWESVFQVHFLRRLKKPVSFLIRKFFRLTEYMNEEHPLSHILHYCSPFLFQFSP